MKKLVLKSLIAAIAISVSGAAQAEVFTYKVEGNRGTSIGGGHTILTIDTQTGKGSLVGGNINASFESDFSSFSGGENPDFGAFDLNSLTGSRTVNGETFAVADVSGAPHPYRLITDGDGGINLWAFWGEGNQHGDYFADTVGYIPPAPVSSSSTSTGGLSSTGGISSTSSSSTSTGGSTPAGSTGGTDVPAPGALLLFGLGAAGLAFGNRRRKVKIKD